MILCEQCLNIVDGHEHECSAEGITSNPIVQCEKWYGPKCPLFMESSVLLDIHKVEDHSYFLCSNCSFLYENEVDCEKCNCSTSSADNKEDGLSSQSFDAVVVSAGLTRMADRQGILIMFLFHYKKKINTNNDLAKLILS